jgi:hypothetical protein
MAGQTRLSLALLGFLAAADTAEEQARYFAPPTSLPSGHQLRACAVLGQRPWDCSRRLQRRASPAIGYPRTIRRAPRAGARHGLQPSTAPVRAALAAGSRLAPGA